MADISLKTYQNNLEKLLEDGNHDAVIYHCHHILQHLPKNVATYRLLAAALMDAARWQAAAEVLQRVLSVYPDDEKAHTGLGTVYQRLKEPDRALWHLERAHEKAPNNQQIASSLQELNQEQRGESRLSLTTGSVVRQYLRNQLYDKALDLLTDALNRTPRRADLRLLLARVHLEEGRIVEAAEVALDVLEMLPNCLEANLIMTELWLSEERPSDAQRYISRIEEVAPYLALELAQGAPPSEDAITLPEADYQTEAQRQLAQSRPDWLSQFGGGSGTEGATADAASDDLDLDALLNDAPEPSAPAMDDIDDLFGVDDLDSDDDDDFLADILGDDDDALDFLDDMPDDAPDGVLGDIDDLFGDISSEDAVTSAANTDDTADDEQDSQQNEEWMQYVEKFKDATLDQTMITTPSSEPFDDDEAEDDLSFLDEELPGFSPRTGMTGLLNALDNAEAENPDDREDQPEEEDFASLFSDDSIEALFADEPDFEEEDQQANDFADSAADVFSASAEAPSIFETTSPETTSPVTASDEVPDLFGDVPDDEPDEELSYDELSDELSKEESVDPFAWMQDEEVVLEDDDGEGETTEARTDLANDNADPFAWMQASGIEIVEDADATRFNPVAADLDDDDGLQDPETVDPFAWMQASGIEIVEDEPVESPFVQSHVQSQATDDDGSSEQDEVDPFAWMQESGVELADEDAPSASAAPLEPVEDIPAENALTSEDPAGTGWLEDDSLLDEMLDVEALTNEGDNLFTGMSGDMAVSDFLDGENAIEFEDADSDAFTAFADETGDLSPLEELDEEATPLDNTLPDADDPASEQEITTGYAPRFPTEDAMPPENQNDNPDDDDLKGLEWLDESAFDEQDDGADDFTGALESDEIVLDWMADPEDVLNVPTDAPINFEDAEFDWGEELTQDDQPAATTASDAEATPDLFGFAEDSGDTDPGTAGGGLFDWADEFDGDDEAAPGDTATTGDAPSWLLDNLKDDPDEDDLDLDNEQELGATAAGTASDLQADAPDWLAEPMASDNENLFGDDDDFGFDDLEADETPDWLAEIGGADDDQPVAARADDDEPMFDFSADGDDDTPDWLSGIGGASDDGAADDDQLAATPGWLADDDDFDFGMEEEAVATDDTPDWLAGIGDAVEAEVSENESGSLPDEELPAWLTTDDEADELEADATMDDQPAWLMNLGMGDDTADDDSADDEEDDTPEWLRGVQAGTDVEADDEITFQDEPAPQRSGLTGLFSDMSVENAYDMGDDDDAGRDDDIPDWMGALDDDEEAPAAASAADDTPDWLQDLQPEAVNDEVISDDDFGDFDSDDDAESRFDAFSFEQDDAVLDEIPSWLADLSAEDDEGDDEPEASDFTADTAEEATDLEELAFEEAGVEEATIPANDLSWLDADEDDFNLGEADDQAEVAAEAALDWLNAFNEDEAAEEPTQAAASQFELATFDEGEGAELYEETQTTPADNAPDWLNAMVPGLDLDYEAEEDAPIEQSYVDQNVDVAKAARSGSQVEFDWLVNIVEEEVNAPPENLPLPSVAPSATAPAGRSGGRFNFSRLPAWLRRQRENNETASTTVEDMNFDEIGDDLPDWLDYDDID